MKISEISLGLRVTGTTKAAVVSFYFIIKGSAKVQVEVSKIKMQIFLHSGSRMPWRVSGLPSWIKNPWTKRMPGRGPWGPPHNLAGLCGEEGQRNRRLDRLTNRNKCENAFK